MIRSASVSAAAVLGLGLVVAAPASAASAGSPAGTGYLASPKALHSVSVVVTVPALHCTTSSPSGVVRQGLFTVVRTGNRTSPVSLTVDASCHAGAARYATSYRGTKGSGGGVHIHRGDRVRLRLGAPGSSSFSIDDLTTGAGAGGASGGGPGPAPRTERHALIGARHAGHAPSVVITFARAKVNGRPLAHVAHHRSDKARVSALKGGDFHVRVGRR